MIPLLSCTNTFFPVVPSHHVLFSISAVDAPLMVSSWGYQGKVSVNPAM